MFNKFKNRMMPVSPNNFNQANNPNMYQGYPQSQYPQYNDQMDEFISYNQYDIKRIDEQLNDLKRIHSDILKRISQLENYLGINNDSNASNFFNK